MKNQITETKKGNFLPQIWLILFPHLPTQNSAETAEKRVALGMKCTEMFNTAKIEINTIIHMQR